MATSRLELRIDSKIKNKAEKAAALLGLKSLTEYVVKIIEADSEQVIKEHENIVLEKDIFDKFMYACNNAKNPNNNLLNAAKFTKNKGF